MTKILIVGGSGFIGTYLVRQLANKGYDISVFDLQPCLSDIKYYSGDVRIIKEINLCLQEFKPDVIIYLAAIHYIPQCIEHPDETMDINLGGLINFMESSWANNLKPYLIFASSAAVYQPYDFACQEDTTPVGPIDIYGQSKLMGEQKIMNWAKLHNLNYSIVRIFNVFGQGDNTPHIIPHIIKQLHENKTIKVGNTLPKRDYIHASDVANGIALCVKHKPTHGLYNLGTGKEYSVDEIFKKIQSYISKYGINPEELKIEQNIDLKRTQDRLHLLSNSDKAFSEINWHSMISFDDGLFQLLQQEGLTRNPS